MSRSIPDILKAVHRCRGNALILIRNGEVTDIYESKVQYFDEPEFVPDRCQPEIKHTVAK